MEENYETTFFAIFISREDIYYSFVVGIVLFFILHAFNITMKSERKLILCYPDNIVYV